MLRRLKKMKTAWPIFGRKIPLGFLRLKFNAEKDDDEESPELDNC